MSFEPGQATRGAVHANGAQPDDGAAPEPSAEQKDREAAWKAIETFAKNGTGNARELPLLIKRVGWNEGVIGKLPDIAKQIDGDLVLECARAADMSLQASLDAAFGAKSPPKAAAVKRLLRTQGMSELGQLSGDVVDKLRVMLPGPFADVLPELAAVPWSMADNPKLVAWFLDTTDPTIAGIHLAGRGSQETLVATLDQLPNGWDWVDHMHIAPSEEVGFGLVAMAGATTNATARPKLEALAKQFTQDDTKRDAEKAQAQKDLGTELRGADDATLIETAARTQKSVPGDAALASKRLAGESASMVIEYLTTTKQTAEQAILLIHGAAGVTKEHVREVLRLQESADLVRALADDGTRKMVRKHLGRDTSLFDLFPHHSFADAHKLILGERALRVWAYEDDHPDTLLQLAAGSADGAALGTQLVKKEKTNSWVKKLSPGADEASLRRFALTSTDADAVRHVKEALLRDSRDAFVDASESEVVPVDNLVYGVGAEANLKIATIGVAQDGEEAVARLADLDARERAAVLGDKQQLTWLLDDVTEHTLVRAMFLLRPSVQQLVQMPLPAGRTYPELLSYLSTRPHGEGFVAVKDPAQIKRLRALLGPWSSPVDIFPELRDGDRLGKALLGENEELFEWIMEDTEPSRAMTILGQNGVRGIARHYLSERQDLTDDLPDHEHLLKEGKRSYGLLHEGLEGTAREDSQDYIDGEASVDKDANKRAKKLERAAEKDTLWDSIDALTGTGDNKPGMLSLVKRAPADQQVGLLDGTHEDSVRHLRHATHMMPQHIFTELSTAQLFALEGSASWLFTWEAPTVLLQMLAGSPAAIKSAAKRIEANPTVLLAWPRGGALSQQERFVLDELAKHVTGVAAMHELFATRFDVTIENFDAAETKKLWKVVARLPPAQFNQQAVEKLIETDIAPLGQWSDPNIEIDDTASRFEQPDASFDEQQKLTRDDVKEMYGLTDAEVDMAATPDTGWLVEDQGTYTVRPVESAQLDSTVLHEIGHSIDTMLGEQTELVYGLAGWKKYGVGQFEQWAEDMGGFNGIDDADRPRVVEAWRTALTSQTPVDRLVGPDHPARKGPPTAPLVDAANRGTLFRYTEDDKHVYGDHVCVTNGAALYSMTRGAYLAAPSEYSLSAPAEYFAECYVEYYRGYDGTPKTEDRKGGRLAHWLRAWFDQNVDRIRLNPKRVRKP